MKGKLPLLATTIAIIVTVSLDTPISEVLASAIENGSPIMFYASTMISYLLRTIF